MGRAILPAMFRVRPRRILTEPRAAILEVRETGTQTSALLQIDGLVCSACAANVGRRLRALEGVRDASVNLESGRASITYEAAAVGPDDLLSAIDGAVVLPSLRRLLARARREPATRGAY
jgi:copper chaperone CopZ